MDAAVFQAWAQGWAPAAAAGLATFVMTRRVLEYLHRKQVLDVPNERSSHSRPVPRGGGLATTPVMAALLTALAVQAGDLTVGLLAAGAMALLAISWLDDRKGLPPLPRFLVQGMVVAAALALDPRPVFGGMLPGWADCLVAGLGWIWFINLYNFMDGIDGITGGETLSLGVGIAVVASLAGGALGLIPPALAVAAVGAAFLLHNWHPAKLFLGDSGSIPFGFVVGGLLVQLAAAGHLAEAVILPAYYLADATITIAKRALRGEKIWQAHRQHFYQRAVQGGRRHDQVVLAILAGNTLLVGSAALAAAGWTTLGLGAATAVAAGLLTLLHRWSKDARP